MQKTVLSFYADDTNPYVAPPAAFKTFLDFISAEGVRGESSVILGYDWDGDGHLPPPLEDVQGAYIEQVQRAFSCGIDTHCELYTHSRRYDFAADRMPDGAIHEGLWLYEPAVSAAEYESYFGSILAQGDRLGIRFTGVTWPGCGCAACNQRYGELRQQGISDPNPNLWQALLNLLRAERFRGHTLPCFFNEDVPVAQAQRMAGEGKYGVFTLPPNAGDHLATWLNDPRYANADRYISADGQSGRIVELVRAGVPYCMFFSHWQGLNPANGAGWEAFTQVVRRVQKHLRDQVVWMRPSEYTDTLVGG